MSSKDQQCDVIVVGAGPAGSVLSILLGRAGYAVQLYEQARFPREKPCGEGLLPVGVEVLRDINLLEQVRGHSLSGVRYHIGEDSIRAGFGSDEQGRTRHGLGQRRCALDQVLWKNALQTSGVVALDGTKVGAPLLENGRVTGVVINGSQVRARLVVAADGSQSMLRRKLGLETVLKPERVGIRSHYRCAPGQLQRSDIQVFLRSGYEIYVTPLPGDEVVVAALAHANAEEKNLRRAFASWIQKERIVCDLLSSATQTSELMGRTFLLKRAKNRAIPPGLVLLGDASESVDPITAGGMSLALASAHSLASHMAEILGEQRRARQLFERRQARAIRTHAWLGAGLRLLSRSPLAAAGAKNLILAHPETMDGLLAIATTR